MVVNGCSSVTTNNIVAILLGNYNPVTCWIFRRKTPADVQLLLFSTTVSSTAIEQMQCRSYYDFRLPSFRSSIDSTLTPLSSYLPLLRWNVQEEDFLPPSYRAGGVDFLGSLHCLFLIISCSTSCRCCSYVCLLVSFSFRRLPLCRFGTEGEAPGPFQCEV